MNKRFVIIYWLLLLVPTLLISVGLFQLLLQEQNRMVEAVFSSARDRAKTIAETIQITTRGVEQTIEQALLIMSSENLIQMLPGLATTTDLVSNVFAWSPEKGLLFPVPGDTTTPEVKHFVERYNDLFTGRVPWNSFRIEPTGDLPFHASAANQTKLAQETDPIGEVNSGKGKYSGQKPYPPIQSKGGWIPWFKNNRLSLLGWAQRKSDNLIYGADLDLSTLLSWLVIYLPEKSPGGVEYALLEGRNRILHQTGTEKLPAHAKPDLTVSLAPLLPHWNVAMYMVNPPLAAKSSKSYLILAGLLLAIFVVAIILGGIMLTWQAQRNITYAHQKTTFVSNVSHELKTPLTSIRMFAELLKEERIKDPAKKNHYLQVIVAESQRLTRLVNNVLDFGRLEQGHKQYHFRELEITEFLRGVVDTQRLRVQKAGMVLENEIPDDEYRVQTDQDAIEQVLLNLMDNAIKYAAEGRELTVDLKMLDDSLKLMIMDRGPGVPAKHQSRIFEKFHRVDNSLTSRQPGSGLGLSIARSIMREMKGDVFYEPRVGGGSCFVILIPLLPEQDIPA